MRGGLRRASGQPLATDLFPAEIFMPPGYIAVFCLPICLLWFGWSANRTHWACPAIATMLFGPGAFLGFMSSLNYLMLSFPVAILPIFCLNAVSRGTVAAFGPLYADKALDGCASLARHF